ncbi:TPA: hypothetical protein DCY43_00270 [candidate division WWE3 bacterium]|uniref:ATP synthase subunit b n=3 Tax=Katanobacteria TaxID=422282 RepID=A0A0G1HE59_UNCKA|nr:MAG: hypothetical protein UW36_C0002G0023 [candidate division WWE3 bacterium GW2011_GWA2_44_16]OGC51551.1 MAG: hypothetical protein A2709_00540 [candidate division WWE3 bacterium RIFCSPHIGHO2_01_FULL_43_9]HAZ29176.1 hypothetical protein [candidate division WWE3 bacterium]
MPDSTYATLPSTQLFLLFGMLFVILSFFIAVFIWTAILYDKKKKEEAKAKEEAYRKALVILEEAKNKSFAIIKESNERAKRLIKETDVAVDESKDFVEGQLRKAASELKADVLTETKSFREQLHTEALQTEKELKDKIAQEYLAIESELKTYKEKRLRDIDEKALNVIETIVNEYFAKTLRSEDHMDLIRQLLDKTKKPFEFEA